MPPNPTVPVARVVLVTGAARRLGREIALALASGGWQVAVHYRSSEADAIKTVADCADISGAAAAFYTDLSSEASVRGLLPEVIARFGRVDAVVNSASNCSSSSRWLVSVSPGATPTTRTCGASASASMVPAASSAALDSV